MGASFSVNDGRHIHLQNSLAVLFLLQALDKESITKGTIQSLQKGRSEIVYKVQFCRITFVSSHLLSSLLKLSISVTAFKK